MSGTVLLSADDLRPLREQAQHAKTMMQVLQSALLAQHQTQVRHQYLSDHGAGDVSGLKLSVTAQDGQRSGLRIFGNPPHNRTYMLLDQHTRSVLAVMDYGVLNSLRVGATAAVAAHWLASPQARTVGLIGSGWQAQPQLDGLFQALPHLEEVRVFSPTPANRERFARDMTARLNIQVTPVSSVQAAVDGADVVDLCGPGHADVRSPLFDSAWVKPGALVIAMAPNQCPVDFVRQSQIVASSWDALTQPDMWPPFDTLIEQQWLKPEHILTIGAIIAAGGRTPASSDQCTLYHLEGASASDLFVASWAHDWACAQGVGQRFQFS